MCRGVERVGHTHEFDVHLRGVGTLAVPHLSEARPAARQLDGVWQRLAAAHDARALRELPGELGCEALHDRELPRGAAHKDDVGAAHL